MIRRVDYLLTPTSLPVETPMFRIISTYLCDRGDLLDLNDISDV